MASLQELICIGLTFLLIMLRLEAERFGAAEYDEVVDGRSPSGRRRIAWYLIGFVLIGAIVFIHPQPREILMLGVGDRGLTILWGFAYAAIGTGCALGVAYYRY